MAIGIGGAALIGAGASLLGQGGNAYAQGKMNKKTREWNDKNWDKQQAQNLNNWFRQNDYDFNKWKWQNEYAEQRWHIQNQYNLPSAQMQRYKDAGLNANLIYGQSNTAGAIDATPQGSNNIESARPGSWNPRAPQIDLGGAMMQYVQMKNVGAQTNNLEAQNKVIAQEAALKAAQTANTVQNTAKSKFELQLASELRQNSLDYAAANLNLKQNQAQAAFDANERAAIAHSQSLQEGYERILNLRQQRKNNELDQKLKELDNNLKRLGIQPTDNLMFRILGQFFDDAKNMYKNYSLPKANSDAGKQYLPTPFPGTFD